MPPKTDTASRDEFVVKPRLYVLAVGVSKYQNPEFTLGFPAKDATDFAAAFQRQKGGLYRDVELRLLTNENATRDDIIKGLDWIVKQATSKIMKQATSKDVAVVFMAGQSANDQNGQFFFLPYDANTENLRRTGISFSDLQSAIAALPAKTLFFIDASLSGSVMGTHRVSPDISGLVNELSSADNGAVVFAASTGRQYSLEDQAWGNSAFTKALVEGLNGKADYNNTGTITINMLYLYVSERVKVLTRGQQAPTMTRPVGIEDLPIAMRIPE